MNNIYLFVGESGSGKTSIVTALENQHNLKSIQSYTTRPARSLNETGHTFVTDEQFNELTDLVGYTEYNGYRYCATSEQAENNDLYVIDPDGIDYFLETYKGSKSVKIIYIKSPIHTRIERMEQRGDKFADIMTRIVNDTTVFKAVSEKADIVITNDDNTSLESIVNKVWTFIKDNDKNEER